MSKRVLYVATVVKTHIMHFHIPYLKMFKEAGWHTAVVARNDYEDPSECNIPYCDEHIDIAFERSPLKWANVKAYRKLKKIIDEGNYDIVHCHTPVAAMLTRFAAIKARKRGTKVFYTAHGFHFFKGAPLLNWMVYFPAEWLCSFMTDTLITINQEDYARAKKHMHAKVVEYIPGIGIDIDRYVNTDFDKIKVRHSIGVPEDACMLLSVGELNDNKNHHIIIKAMARLNEVNNLHYVLAGSGPNEESLKDFVKALGLDSRVHILGYRQDIPELNNAADVFCFPSRREGLGLAALEAMASGIPIITSNVHGINDYSIDGVTGFKCAPDDVNGFADAIEKMACNEGLRAKMSVNVKQMVERYSINHSMAAMKRIYDASERKHGKFKR